MSNVKCMTIIYVIDRGTFILHDAITRTICFMLIGSALLLTISQLIRGEVAVWYATMYFISQVGLFKCCQTNEVFYLHF
ncbi:hypothetical protein D910_04818 [Dendroctonus ponderosae]|uniref:Uncharacterized protein n=1 Tax=Dendroctonus ponderosae TaxID=77166 RepID=U4U0P3_DENPD|nr:hypothetical protein D910_04818 [Dendroctonus ponderosae]